MIEKRLGIIVGARLRDRNRIENAISIYDAFYIALAKDLELTFITADRRLCERVRGLDYVEFIGEM